MGDETFCDLCGLSAEVIKIALPQPEIGQTMWHEYLICKECADTISAMWRERLEPIIVEFGPRR